MGGGGDGFTHWSVIRLQRIQAQDLLVEEAEEGENIVVVVEVGENYG